MLYCVIFFISIWVTGSDFGYFSSAFLFGLCVTILLAIGLFIINGIGKMRRDAKKKAKKAEKNTTPKTKIKKKSDDDISVLDNESSSDSKIAPRVQKDETDDDSERKERKKHRLFGGDEETKPQRKEKKKRRFFFTDDTDESDESGHSDATCDERPDYNDERSQNKPRDARRYIDDGKSSSFSDAYEPRREYRDASTRKHEEPRIFRTRTDPNVLIYEYSDRLEFFRRESNGNLTFLSVERKRGGC